VKRTTEKLEEARDGDARAVGLEKITNRCLFAVFICKIIELTTKLYIYILPIKRAS